MYRHKSRFVQSPRPSIELQGGEVPSLTLSRILRHVGEGRLQTRQPVVGAPKGPRREGYACKSKQPSINEELCMPHMTV